MTALLPIRDPASLESNEIDGSVSVSGEVRVGSGNFIGAGVSLRGPIELGSNNYIAAGVRIGGLSRERIEASHRLGDPHPVEQATVAIGDRTMIFENVVIHKPMFAETSIGSGVEIGAQSVVAHDCVVRDGAVLSPHVVLGAYVTIGERANLGLNSAVHNRVVVGGLSMCGLAAAVVGHVRPCGLVYGNPARLSGINAVGLRRSGIEKEEDEAILESLRQGTAYASGIAGPLFRQFEADLTRWPSSKGEVKWSTPV